MGLREGYHIKTLLGQGGLEEGRFWSQRCFLHFTKLSNSRDQTIHEGLGV